MPSGVIAITCEGVSKSFPVTDGGNAWRIVLGRDLPHMQSIQALREITLSVPKGEIVGILGRNGAGKSTLLRTLGGVYLPTTGSVRVQGDLSGLFELGGLGNPYLTGRDYAYRSLTFQGAKKDKIETLLEEVKDFSELKEYFDRPIFSYSSGMAARLYFATATAIPHDVYLIDEILSVGDEHFQGKCWRRMRQLLSQGASGVLVTHDWSAVIKLCRETHIVDRGRITASGPSDQIVASYLGLTPPEKRIAYFEPSLLKTYTAIPGQDIEFFFEIQVLEPTPVLFGYSIELLRLGIGWEIMLLSDPVLVSERSGSQTLRLKIPQLPLVPGEYSFNLFLNSLKNESFDIRSWTFGNGIRLLVHGDASANTVAHLPVQWGGQCLL